MVSIDHRTDIDPQRVHELVEVRSAIAQLRLRRDVLINAPVTRSEIVKLASDQFDELVVRFPEDFARLAAICEVPDATLRLASVSQFKGELADILQSFKPKFEAEISNALDALDWAQVVPPLPVRIEEIEGLNQRLEELELREGELIEYFEKGVEP